MNQYKEPFYVNGVKVQLTDILGTFVWHPDEKKRNAIVKYLGDEGFFDKDHEYELVFK